MQYDHEMQPLSVRYNFFRVTNTSFFSVQMVVDKEEMHRDATKISVSVSTIIVYSLSVELQKMLKFKAKHSLNLTFNNNFLIPMHFTLGLQ